MSICIKFACPYCNRSFYNKTSLTEHLQSDKCTHEKKHICELCAKEYSYYASFVKHCEKCGGSRPPASDEARARDSGGCYSFINAPPPPTHWIFHASYTFREADPKHRCDECGKMFRNMRNLNIHRRAVHEKPAAPPRERAPLGAEDAGGKRRRPPPLGGPPTKKHCRAGITK